MKDEALQVLAASQRNRVSRRQALEIGLSPKALHHRLATGRLTLIHDGVYAFPPVLHDDMAQWIGVTLTAPDTYLNRLSAACAYGVLEHRPPYETVVRPGASGPKRCDGIVVYRSTTLNGETATYQGVPITSMPRTLLDLACFVSDRALARAVRESVRLNRTTVRELGDHLFRFEGRAGFPRLIAAIGRYRDLPLDRARSGAEIRAMELLRDASRPMPRLNVHVAGVEADLSWPRERLIIEIDGGPFHQDKGEDARKEEAWRSAGWRVTRISSDDVYERPQAFLALAP